MSPARRWGEVPKMNLPLFPNNRCFIAAIPPQTRKEYIMKLRLTPPPRVAALLIALMLAGSAGVAGAATTASSGSWYAPYLVWMQCAAGNTAACMATSGGAGTVSPDGDPIPVVKNT